MCTIIDLKDKFNSLDCYNVYSACMYMPTVETFYKRASTLIEDKDVYVFGFVNENKIKGIVAIKQNNDVNAEIIGIAVDSSCRKQGIGRQLVNYAVDNLNISVLFAETDDDAISFYRQCGFQTEEFYKSYKNGIFKRYKCYLLKNDNNYL